MDAARDLAAAEHGPGSPVADPARVARPGDPPVRGTEVVTGVDAAAVGRGVRARLDAGRRVAAFVGDVEGDADAAEALDAFVADVVRPDHAP